MAYFAKLDENNVVTFVTHCVDVLLLENGVEVKDNPRAIEHLNNTIPNDIAPGIKWLQTSFNNSIRKNFAGMGMIYNAEHDAFHSPGPNTLNEDWSSWTLNEDFQWIPPIPYPTEEDVKETWTWKWNEENHQVDNTTGWELVKKHVALSDEWRSLPPPRHPLEHGLN